MYSDTPPHLPPLPPPVPSKPPQVSPRIQRAANYFQNLSDLSTRVDNQQLVTGNDVRGLQEGKYVDALKAQSEGYFTSTSLPLRPRLPRSSTSTSTDSSLVLTPTDGGFDDANIISIRDSKQSNHVAAKAQLDAPISNEKATNSRRLIAVESEVQNEKSRGNTIALDVIALSDGISELHYALEELKTILFEIQELRHGTRHLSSTHNNAESPVDLALVQMETRMESARSEFAFIQSRVSDVLRNAMISWEDSEMLKRRWNDVNRDWSSIQEDAEVLGDELKEDKWLVVFRTVAQQATDMMESLEKILNQSDQFITDLSNRQFGSSPTAAHLSDFMQLRTSLTAKIKYYAPACDRVLKILAKGIKGRSTTNGEVSRTFSEIRIRWYDVLVVRIARTEREMEDIGAILNEDEIEELLSPSPPPPLPPPIILSRIPRSASNPAISSPVSSRSTDPPAAVKSNRRLSSIPTVQTHSHLSRTPRHSLVSAPSSAHHYLSPTYNESTSLAPNHRSKTPTQIDTRPRWNISTRPITVPPPDSKSLSKSLGSNEEGSRAGSALGTRRSTSRLSMGGYSSNMLGTPRAASPTYSVFSETVSHRRPATPSSRIPIPSSPPISSRRQSMIPSSKSLYQQLSLPVLPSTPTPSNHPEVVESVSPTKSRSRLPRRSSVLPAPRSTTPVQSSTTSSPTKYDRAHTPEPKLAAQSKRFSNLFRSTNRPPPLPSIPPSLRKDVARPLSMASYSNLPSVSSPRPRTSSTAKVSSSEFDGYTPNYLDDLDVAIAAIINALPLTVRVQRLDPPLTRNNSTADQTSTARYFYSVGNHYAGGGGRKALVCKVVSRVIASRERRGEKRVVVRVGSGWRDLESLALELVGFALASSA